MRLNKTQEKLLRKAIQTWVDVEAKPECVLCDKYFIARLPADRCCVGCPVFQYTGKGICGGTPDEGDYKTFGTQRRATINFGNKILKACGKEIVNG